MMFIPNSHGRCDPLVEAISCRFGQIAGAARARHIIGGLNAVMVSS